jgi:hypothetical protein
MSDPILTERADGILRIQINRPEKKNALTVASTPRSPRRWSAPPGTPRPAAEAVTKQIRREAALSTGKSVPRRRRRAFRAFTESREGAAGREIRP